MKFALISNVLPPSETAHAAIIERLLRNIEPHNYCLLSSRDYTRDDQPHYSRKLAGKYFYLPAVFQLTRGYKFGLRPLREGFNSIIGLIFRTRAILRILTSEECTAVIVCTGGIEVLDFPTGYLASRLRRVPFYAYLLDQYAHMVSYILGDSFLRRFEPWILRNAAAVITPNEFLRDEIKHLYGLEARVIHNACDLSVYRTSRPDESNQVASEKKVMYTGAVGDIHFDAFRNLLAAIEILGRDDIKLHLFTAQSQADVERGGVCGNVVYHQHQPLSEMPMIQRQADVLFLPLSFNAAYRQIVETAAPGKMGEFLAAGRPILVHAPRDSYISWYFRQYDCGMVVDESDPTQLAEALVRILTDRDLCERLTTRAWERAVADFDLSTAQRGFAEVIGLDLAS